MGGAFRKTQLAVKEIEEAGVPELSPRSEPIELRELEEKIHHRHVLPTEQIGQTPSKNACVRHAGNMAEPSDTVASRREGHRASRERTR